MMNWLNNLNDSKNDDDLEDLTRRLLSYRNEAVFLDALREATALASNGDDLGVRGLTEAVRRRCDGKNIAFYTPSVTLRPMANVIEAKNDLFELAESSRLLEDPAATQSLMSAALTISENGLSGLVDRIFAYVGNEQGYGFQLLFNQMHSSIKLKHIRGELS